MNYELAQYFDQEVTSRTFISFRQGCNNGTSGSDAREGMMWLHSASKLLTYYVTETIRLLTERRFRHLTLASRTIMNAVS